MKIVTNFIKNSIDFNLYRKLPPPVQKIFKCIVYRRIKCKPADIY